MPFFPPFSERCHSLDSPCSTDSELFYTFTLSCVFRPFPSSKFPNRSLKQNQTLKTTISWPYHPTQRPLYQGHPLPSVKIDWRCSIYSDFFLPTTRWHISTIRLMLPFLLRKLSQNNMCLSIGNRVSALSLCSLHLFLLHGTLTFFGFLSSFSLSSLLTILSFLLLLVLFSICCLQIISGVSSVLIFLLCMVSLRDLVPWQCIIYHPFASDARFYCSCINLSPEYIGQDRCKSFIWKIKLYSLTKFNPHDVSSKLKILGSFLAQFSPLPPTFDQLPSSTATIEMSPIPHS